MRQASLRAWLLLPVCGAFLLWAGIGRSGVQPPAASNQPPDSPLAWDAMEKEAWPDPGDEVAHYVFSVTNVSDHPVTIIEAQASCGCTKAELPEYPWHLAPHGSGKMHVDMDLGGKFGTDTKTVTVISTNFPVEILTVVVHMPDSPEAVRMRNVNMAKADREAVFKGDCARCHAAPAEGKMGKALYAATCAVCHEAKNRATMVPNLHKLDHPTDYDFWKMIINTGKPGTLMPAFGKAGGGPLTDEQVESLARTLVVVLPSNPLAGRRPTSNSIIRLPPPGSTNAPVNIRQ